MEKAYRGMIGGYSIWKDGDEKHEPTHKILTNEEYLKLISQIKSLERQLSEEQTAHTSDVNTVKKQAQAYKQRVDQEAQEKVDEALKQVTAAKEEAKYQTELNTTLLEISKNRANADRRLKPKKEHSGYLVVSSTEKPHKYKDGSYMKEIAIWETVIQTPYNVDFSEAQARKQIKNDLFKENDSWLIGKIGINATWGNGMAKLLKDEEYREYNCKIGEHVRANFKAGYWEVIYTHTKPLGIVPKEMRAS